MASYAARLSPLQGETVWTIEKSVIVERRTGRERRFPLAELRGVTRAGRGAVLQFQRRRLTIPALSYGEALRPQDQGESFERFLTALSLAAPDRPIRRPSPNTEAVLWIMGLMALTMITVPKLLIGAFIDVNDPANAAVVGHAVTFLAFAALFQVADGAQAVGAGMLRGLQDTTVPMIYAAIGYWGISMTVGATLAFHFALGGSGIWLGLCAGLAVVAVLLLYRWTQRDRLEGYQPVA